MAWLVVGATVGEAASWLEVAVDVAEDIYLTLFFHHFGQELAGVHDGVQPGRGIGPPPVHIKACEICPMVALDDSIWVEHRHDIEDVLLSQFFRFFEA